jgi:hypothetical protein
MRKYGQYIYGFDIETTTIRDKDGELKSLMYVGTFGKLSFVTGKIKKDKVIRTWQDFDKYLYMLDRAAAYRQETQLLYCHNNYEWSFIVANSKFFQEKIKESKSETLMKNERKPLFIRAGNIELRDSLLLLDKSIAELGEELGLPKLDYDYKKERFSTTRLESRDYDYNWRDVEIQLAALWDLIQTDLYIQSLADIPLTSTGRTRKYNRYDFRVNDEDAVNYWAYHCKQVFPR